MAVAHGLASPFCRFRSVVGRLFVVVGFTLLALARPAAAQDLTPTQRAALQHQKDALFQRMLKNPSNLDVTFAYANVASKLGDYEAAVSALDRMLLFNPRLSRVQLELGALYFKMGAYDLARDYFSKVAASKPPPAVKARIAEYLGLIAKAQSRSKYTGYVFTGIQYQSDATLGPSTGTILALVPPGFIVSVTLPNQFRKNSDEDIFAIGSVTYNYDLRLQNRDSIEATGLAVVNHYFTYDRLDLDLGEVTLGPRLNFKSGLFGRPASAKPYLILNEVGLGEDQYFFTYGVGIEYEQPVWRDLSFRGLFEFRQKKFSNAIDRPTSTGLDGSDKLVSLQLTKPVTANSVLNLQFDYLNEATRFAYYGNNTYALSGSYSIRYEAPFGLTRLPWQSTVYLARSWALYDSPDPCCFVNGGFGTRDDRHWRFGLTEAVLLSPHTALVLQLQRDIVSSNLPLYGYTSDSVVFGPQIRF